MNVHSDPIAGPAAGAPNAGLTLVDVAALSALLDEAFELPPEAIEGWLAQLPSTHRHLCACLRAVLARHGAVVSHFMVTPAFDGVAATLAHPGDRVGAYRLVRELGVGGMGAVWLAEREDGVLRRRVALKLPRLAWGDTGLAERMARERDIAALLEHPGIARLYDAGVDAAGRPFIALEVIDGVPLDQWARAHNRSVDERLRLFIQIARAVAYAHGRLVVHRDLKPSNVLVDADDRAHLLDFGIAKLLDDVQSDVTRAHGRLLTPRYAAPEQLRGEPASVSCDIWSLGVLLHEMLTGRLPFRAAADSAAALEHAIEQTGAPRASADAPDAPTARRLRGDLDAIVAKALQPDAAMRYATADALADDVQRHLDGERVLAQPDRVSYRLGKALRRHWLGATATTCVVLAVIAGAVSTAVQARKALEASERERVVREFVAEMFRANGTVGDGAQASPATRVEGGARLIETRFGGQPALQAELYGVVSGVFLDMGANGLAADYAAREIERARTAQATREEIDSAMLRRARALFEDDHRLASANLLRTLLRQPGLSPALEDDVRILLARSLNSTGQYAELNVVLNELERENALAHDAPSARKAWTQSLRAEREACSDRYDGSLGGFDAAIRTALDAEGLHSNAAMEIRLRTARLVSCAASNLSEPYFNAAENELRSRGGAFAVRAAYEGAYYRFTLGRNYQASAIETIAAIERSRSELEQSPMRPPQIMFTRLDLFEAQMRVLAGDMSRMSQLFQAANSLDMRTLPLMKPWLDDVVAHALGAMGRESEALEWGRRSEDDYVKVGGVSSDTGMAWFRILAAENRLAGDHPQAAFEEMEGAARDLSTAGSPRNIEMTRDAIVATQSKALLALGSPQSALDLVAPHFHGDAHPTDRPRRFVDVILMGTAAGEALCALHRSAEGLRDLLATEDYMAHNGWLDTFPMLVRARASAAACALDLGRVEEARRLARLARDAVTRQPEIADYFKAPLVGVEGRLRHRA